MTLQERAFMIDLINRRFDSKINKVVSRVGYALISASLIFLLENTSNVTVLVIMLYTTGIFSAFSAIFNLFVFSPWATRDAQFKCLDENRGANFEELTGCVPLKEFLY